MLCRISQFTFLQSAIVPGSCPNIGNIQANVPTYKPLTVVGGAAAYDTTVKYSVEGKVDSTHCSLVYLTGHNLPLTVPIKNVYTDKYGVSTFEASLPFSSKGFAQGLTIAALVKGTGKQFASIADVAADTVFGPGIIEIN